MKDGRHGRAAEGGGLLNRYTGKLVSGVRIPLSPPIFISLYILKDRFYLDDYVSIDRYMV
jgi:hypothetical protein